MTNLEAEKEFEELKKWFLEESNKIDEKYPYNGALDHSVEASDERTNLRNEFNKRLNEIGRKYKLK